MIVSAAARPPFWFTYSTLQTWSPRAYSRVRGWLGTLRNAVGMRLSTGALVDACVASASAAARA